MTERHHPWEQRGRGTSVNPAHRFDDREVVPFDDGWGSLEIEPPQVETKVIEDATRTILTRNDSPDVPFDLSINPYRGCEHGCIYCFARPSHAYLGYSPGLDFETRIVAKPKAARLLARELSGPGYEPSPIALGSNTDPYQPAERELGITRGILQVLWEHRHPVGIVTKSAMVLRDLDLLRDLARHRLVHVMVSITTLRPELARIMEPRAAAPHRRVETLQTLAEEGIPVGVLASPMIPGLNDEELEPILEAAARAGAGKAGWILVRLPDELKELFSRWLEEHMPARKERVLNRIRAARGGRLNDPRFGRRMRGEGIQAGLLADRFDVACRRLGLDGGLPPLDRTAFRIPPQAGDQVPLFEEAG